jgi:hypothetical protein
VRFDIPAAASVKIPGYDSLQIEVWLVTEVAEDCPASIFKVVKEEGDFTGDRGRNSSETVANLHN